MDYHLIRVNVINDSENLLLFLMKQGKMARKEHTTRLKNRLIKILVKEPGWK
jgi:hypothetical protein